MAKVRAVVFVEPEVLKVYEALAEAVGIPVSRAMSDLLTEAAPRMAGVAKMARTVTAMRTGAVKRGKFVLDGKDYAPEF
jgi:hypothetical protein